MSQVGWALVATGLLDIGVMIYCIIHRINYSSSLNFFAVVIGALLIRGNLGAARFAKNGSAFLLGAFVLMPVLSFLNRPLALTQLSIRLYPGATILAVLLLGGLIALLWWVYRRLDDPAILAAYGREQSAPPSPAKYAAIGAGIALLASGMLFFAMRGDTARKAKELAAAKTGPGFKFAIQSFAVQNDHGVAMVTAYNDSEIRNVAVEW